jgi:hypothetical protein
LHRGEAQAKQRGMSQQQAIQAQGQQPALPVPPAPTGPQGVTQPYPAEEDEQ